MTPKKREWKPAFIDALKETGNVARSARAARISRTHAYRERNNSAMFREAWDEAIEEGLDYLEEEARRRAYHGVEKPVFYQGDECGYVREFSDTLMIFLLKGRRGEVYGDRVKQEHSGSGGGPIEIIEVSSGSSGENEGSGPSWP